MLWCPGRTDFVRPCVVNVQLWHLFTVVVGHTTSLSRRVDIYFENSDTTYMKILLLLVQVKNKAPSR